MKNNKLILIALAAMVAAGGAISCAKKASAVSRIVITPSTVAISEGERCSLKAKVLPDGMAQNVSWKCLNSEIATVDQEGNVFGIKGGQTYVTASAGGVMGGCLVNVMAHVEGVELDRHEAEVDLDGVMLLKAQILPKNAYNDTVYWSSTNPAVATVGNGLVTGMSVGEADIIVKTAEGGFTDQCHVYVTCSVKSLTLNKASTKLDVGASETLTATITPENATHKEVRWVSSDPTVASIDDTGKITALKKGFCTITAYSFGDAFSASCEVEVYARVTGVELTQKSLEMYVGDRVSLKANVLPADANNPAVTWLSSSSTYAKVNSATGVVTAMKAGSATITVKTTEGAFTDKCEITVIQGTEPVTGITLDKTSLHLCINGYYELYAAVLPVNALDKKVIWTSSSTSIATVDSNGKVTGKDAGTAEITATTNEGGFIAKCTVTVVGFDATVGGLDDQNYIWD